MNGVLPAALAGVVLITYRGAKQGKAKDNPVPHLPMPADYVGAIVIFGGLAMLTGRASTPAALAAWGLDIAILLNLWNAGGQVKPTNTNANNTTPAPAG